MINYAKKLDCMVHCQGLINKLHCSYQIWETSQKSLIMMRILKWMLHWWTSNLGHMPKVQVWTQSQWLSKFEWIKFKYWWYSNKSSSKEEIEATINRGNSVGNETTMEKKGIKKLIVGKRKRMHIEFQKNWKQRNVQNKDSASIIKQLLAYIKMAQFLNSVADLLMIENKLMV